jgi:hypothetical protein
MENKVRYVKKARFCLRLMLIIMLTLSSVACVSSKYAERTTAVLKDSTSAASIRIANLQNRDATIVAAFNAQRDATLTLIEILDQKVVCELSYWQSVNSLNKASVELNREIDQAYFDAIESLPQLIEETSSEVQKLIDSQTEILTQEAILNSAADKARFIEAKSLFPKLMAARGLIRQDGLIQGFNQLHQVSQGVKQDLIDKKQQHLAALDGTFNNCKTSKMLSQKFTPEFGEALTSPTEKFVEMNRYLKSVENASNELQFYLQSNAFGDKSFAASLMQGMWMGLKDSINLGANNSDVGVDPNTDPQMLKTALNDVTSLVNSAIKDNMASFNINTLLGGKDLKALFSGGLTTVSNLVQKTVNKEIAKITGYPE